MRGRGSRGDPVDVMKGVSSATTHEIIWVDTPEQLAAERKQVHENLEHFGANNLAYQYSEYGHPEPLAQSDDAFCSHLGVSDEFFASYKHALDEDVCTLAERRLFESNLRSLLRIKVLALKHEIELPK